MLGPAGGVGPAAGVQLGVETLGSLLGLGAAGGVDPAAGVLLGVDTLGSLLGLGPEGGVGSAAGVQLGVKEGPRLQMVLRRVCASTEGKHSAWLSMLEEEKCT